MRSGRAIVAAFLLVGALPGMAVAGPSSVAATQLDDAREALKAQEWGKAAAAYQVLADENPYNGEFWYHFASANYQLKNYRASAEAYARAAKLGFQVGTALCNMGCDYALLGDSERAIDALERAIHAGLRQREGLIREDHDLDSIRDSEPFRERILPVVSDGVTRDEGWRMDLDYLTRRMEATHWNVYANISPDEWHETVARLAEDVPRLEDHEIVVELMKLVTRVGDGHTGVHPILGDKGWHIIPVRFYAFKDGIFVRDADTRYESALGKRVVRIGNKPIEDAYDLVATVTEHDNDMQVKWVAPRKLSVVEVLHGLRIVDGLGHVDLVLEDERGNTSKIRVEPVPLRREMMHDGARFGREMNDGAEAPLPLYLERPHESYWFEYLEPERMVYFQFNRVENKVDGESIAEFAERLFGFVEGNEVEALVVDVRFNHGGNNFLLRPLIDEIIRSDKVNEHGRLFTIIGRETFSACQNFVNRLQARTPVIFVGEPTGSKPNFVGEGNPIRLPYSGVVVNGSSRYWQDSVSDDFRVWVAPDLIAELTAADFRENHDPAMDVIRAYLAHREQTERDHAAP